MPNFSQATPSVGALTLSTILAIQQLDAQLTQDGYKVLSAGVQTEGAASRGLSSAIKNSIDKQALATQTQGIGEISSGALQAGGEIGGIAHGWTYNSQIKTAQTALDQATEYNSFARGLQNNNPARLGLVNGNENQPLRAIDEGDLAKLKGIDFAKDSLTDESKRLLEVAQKNDPDLFDKIKEDIAKTMDSKQKDLDYLNKEKSSVAENYGRRFQMMSAVLKGFVTTQAAQAQYLQANYEALKQAAEYAKTTVTGANQATGQQISSLVANQKSAVDIQAAIASANRV